MGSLGWSISVPFRSILQYHENHQKMLNYPQFRLRRRAQFAVALQIVLEARWHRNELRGVQEAQEGLEENQTCWVRSFETDSFSNHIHCPNKGSRRPKMAKISLLYYFFYFTSTARPLAQRAARDLPKIRTAPFYQRGGIPITHLY